MDLFFLQTLILIFLVSLVLYFTSVSQKKRTHNKGFETYPIVGALPEFLANRHRLLEWNTEVLRRSPNNTAVFHRPGGVCGIFTANPSNVEYMLKTNFENYPKGEELTTLLHDFLGQGIFNCDGDIWKVQRKTASYEFNTKSLRNFVMENVKSELTGRLIPMLEKATQHQQVFDMQDVLERFAFDNICKLAFNVDPGCLGDDKNIGREFMRAFDVATNISSDRFLYAVPFLWKIKRIFNLGSEKVLKDSISVVHEFADNIIKSVMESRVARKDEDLLSRFIGNEENSPKFLRDIVISFILAGRDTTSTALSWFFLQLSSNPEVEKKILKELELIRARTGKNIGDLYSFDELRDMHYLHAAISESMRLYPPVPIDTKICQKDDSLPDGTFIGKDWFMLNHTYAMGRMESIWGKDCLEYRPERWLDETGKYRPESQFRFPVFHAGPRICLGKDMAYIQMKSIAASVIERFVFDIQNKHNTEPLLSLTLRMKGGLQVKVKARSVDVIN